VLLVVTPSSPAPYGEGLQPPNDRVVQGRGPAGRSRGHNMPGEPAPSNALFGLVGLGMRAYVRATFRLSILGAENAPLRPGMLIVATHRTDHDVPLMGSLLYLEGRAWRGPSRMHFASRDDLFERGALAGVAPGLPLPLARLLWRVVPAGGLARVRVHPIGRADLVAPAQALRAVDPTTVLDQVFSDALIRRLHERARKRGTRAPTTAGEALLPLYADILFEGTGPEDLDSPLLDMFWRNRAREAVTHLRRLGELVRAGEPLVIFPEGGLSPDGGIGPLRRGFGVLARVSRPSAVLPVALAYDGLVTGRRPRLVVAVGRPFAPEAGQEEDDVLLVLRRLMPLTCGQVVAHAIAEAASRGETSIGVDDLERRLACEIERARNDGRPADPVLRRARSREKRLFDAMQAASRRHIATQSLGRLKLDGERARGDVMLQRLAREYESAREAGVSSP
jgi:1-acyl-sn-glycerol-3-phosphate acyltransferase